MCIPRHSARLLPIVLLTRFLPDGQVFDASNAPGRKPIAFKLGARQVIQGWEEVLRLMNVSANGISHSGTRMVV